MKDDARSHPFRDSHDDVETFARIPDTAQTRAPAYRLAFTDADFMMREELRPVRLQLELLKPEMVMTEYGIESTIVLFGGARIADPERNAAPGPRRFQATSRQVVLAQRQIVVVAGIQEDGQAWRR